MCQLESQLHDVFLVFILHDCPDLQELLNCAVFYLLLGVVEQLVKKFEDLSCGDFLFRLSALLLDKLYQREKLIKECNLNFATFLGQDIE